MTTMTATARRAATAAYAAMAEDDARPARSGADAERLQRRRDRRIAAAAEAGWLLALR